MHPPLPTLASDPNPDDVNFRDATVPKSPIRPGLSYARALNLSENQNHGRIDALFEETEPAYPVEVATTDDASQPAGHTPRADPAAYLHLPSGIKPGPIISGASKPDPTVSRRERRRRQNVPPSLAKHGAPFASISPRMIKHGHGPRRITFSNSSPHSSGKKTLNVDSPSFTPSSQHLATKKSTFSTQAASAAPFTPRGADGKPSSR